ncbi:MAG: DUF4062 domain-containing protein [Pyrinomonadaceae bacterium]
MSGNVHITAPAEYRGSSGLTMRARNAHAFSTVFVSSTRRDLEDYRLEVEATFNDFLGMACFLGEKMAAEYVPTVDACLKAVDASGGFIGIFAYWYGSLPPGQPVSITHMEFKRALGRQRAQPDFPIAVFMPQDPSAAKSELETKALALVGGDDTERRLHGERLKKFHEEVRGGWRVVRDFKDRDELCKWIIAICSHWRGLTPMEAARGGVEVTEAAPECRLPTEEELGLLGRDKHLQAITNALAVAPAYPEEPGLVLLASGNEYAGQRAFLQRLRMTDEVRAGRPPRIVLPPDGCDAAALVQQLGGSLGLAGGAASTPPELAEAVHAGLQQQQLCFVLDQVHRFAGGVAAFREQVWLPLYARLKELRAERPTEHRLVGFVADYSGRADARGGAVEDFDEGATPAYSRLLRLPPLRPFNKADLMLWMNALKVPDKPPGGNPGRRGRIADAVLKGADGLLDGTPLRVFDQLRGEDLWPQGEE